MKLPKEAAHLHIDRGDELVERLRVGDLEAFEEVYKTYRPRLRGFILKVVAREDIVDEVLDDVMMIVWTKIKDFEGRSKFSTWVFSIAYRRALKERGQRIEVELPDEIEGPEHTPDNAQQGLEASRTKERLKAAVSKLPAHQAAVVRLAYFEELSYRDISEIMGCPEETVKTRMFHARRKLKVALGGTLADWV